MKVSASIELVWQIAAREAKAGKFAKIEPDHYCMAVMKLAELPVEDVEKIAAGSDAAKDLAVEVDAVRDALEGKGIEGKQVRRRIRKGLGKGESEPEDGRMHRSDASRKLFDAAAKLADDAGTETLTPTYLLDALLADPTELLEQVLAEMPASPAKADRSKTPLLEELGQDLTDMARKGKLRSVSDRRAECSALIEALVKNESKGVFLVCGKDDPVRSVVAAAAQVIADGDAPKPLKRMRIIDITSQRSTGEGDTKWADRMQTLLDEASAAGKIILFWPPVSTVGKGKSTPIALELLKSAAETGEVQIICRIAPDAFEKHVATDQKWRRIASTMWIQETKPEDIPDEL